MMNDLTNTIATANYAGLCDLKAEFQAFYNAASNFEDAAKALAAIKLIDRRLVEIGYGNYLNI